MSKAIVFFIYMDVNEAFKSLQKMKIFLQLLFAAQEMFLRLKWHLPSTSDSASIAKLKITVDGICVLALMQCNEALCSVLKYTGAQYSLLKYSGAVHSLLKYNGALLSLLNYNESSRSLRKFNETSCYLQKYNEALCSLLNYLSLHCVHPQSFRVRLGNFFGNRSIVIYP